VFGTDESLFSSSTEDNSEYMTAKETILSVQVIEENTYVTIKDLKY
jgi:hypothetical protein